MVIIDIMSVILILCYLRVINPEITFWCQVLDMILEIVLGTGHCTRP